MRTRTLIVGYVLVLLVLFGVGFLTIQPATAIEATVNCTPPFLSLEDPPPAEFRVTIKLPTPHKAEDIDPDSIWVEGIIQMKDVPDWPKVTKKFFAFKVDGPSLINWVILSKVGHMAPPPGTKVDVPVTVTGQLYDETPFQGTFEIAVMTEHASPPPPPP